MRFPDRLPWDEDFEFVAAEPSVCGELLVDLDDEALDPVSELLGSDGYPIVVRYRRIGFAQVLDKLG